MYCSIYCILFYMCGRLTAFDEVLLNGLLDKLIKRNVPLPLVRVFTQLV